MPFIPTGLFAVHCGGLLQFDGCVCCRILTSSFHDWLDFMEKMMEGETVHTISYIITLFIDPSLVNALSLSGVCPVTNTLSCFIFAVFHICKRNGIIVLLQENVGSLSGLAFIALPFTQ